MLTILVAAARAVIWTPLVPTIRHCGRSKPGTSTRWSTRRRTQWSTSGLRITLGGNAGSRAGLAT